MEDHNLEASCDHLQLRSGTFAGSVTEYHEKITHR